MKQLLFSFTRKDFRVDTFRCGGHGGQNVQKRDTGVRITHIESGLSSECRRHRTQEQNKKEAFYKLADKLVEYYCPEHKEIRFAAGHEVIRTYNEPDDRVNDSRTGKRYSYRQTIGKGDISEIIEDTISELVGK